MNGIHVKTLQLEQKLVERLHKSRRDPFYKVASRRLSRNCLQLNFDRIKEENLRTHLDPIQENNRVPMRIRAHFSTRPYSEYLRKAKSFSEGDGCLGCIPLFFSDQLLAWGCLDCDAYILTCKSSSLLWLARIFVEPNSLIKNLLSKHTRWSRSETSLNDRHSKKNIQLD